MIRSSEARDRTRVEALLTAALLPVEGVAEHFERFFVVDEGGRVAGAAGLWSERPALPSRSGAAGKGCDEVCESPGPPPAASTEMATPGARADGRVQPRDARQA